MLVDLGNGRKFDIRFKYTSVVDGRTLHGKHHLSNSNCKIITECIISRVDIQNEKDRIALSKQHQYEEIVRNSVTKHPKDVFDKALGRRLALAGALKLDNLRLGVFSKHDRIKIWDEYAANHSDGHIFADKHLDNPTRLFK